MDAASAVWKAQQHSCEQGAAVPFAPAGSVTIFTEALVHGTVSWRAEHTRRSLLFKYSAKHVAQGRDAVPPTSQELTEAQARLFRPPQENESGDVFHPAEFV